MGGRNAMMGNYEYTPLERSWATISDVPEEHQWYRILLRNAQVILPLTQGQLDKLALHHAIDFVKSHPWLTIQRDIVKFFNFWQLEAHARGGRQHWLFRPAIGRHQSIADGDHLWDVPVRAFFWPIRPAAILHQTTDITGSWSPASCFRAPFTRSSLRTNATICQ